MRAAILAVVISSGSPHLLHATQPGTQASPDTASATRAECLRIARGRGDQRKSQLDSLARHALVRDDPLGVVVCASWALYLQTGTEDERPLRDSLRVLARAAETLGDRRLAAEMFERSGSAAIGPGRLAEAVDDLMLATALARTSGDSLTEFWASANLAQAYYALGDTPAAFPPASRAIALGSHLSSPGVSPTVLALRGDVAVGQRNWDEAARWYRAAVDTSFSTGYIAGAAHACEVWALMLMKQGEWAAAAGRLDQALAALARGGYAGNRGMVLYLRGVVSMRQGQVAAAHGWLRRAARDAEPVSNLQYFIGAREAELLLAAGKGAEARARYDRAVDALDRWLATLDRDDVRLSAFDAAPDEADPDVAAATLIRHFARTDAPGALALVERQRGRELLRRVAGATSRSAFTATTIRQALPRGTALVEYVTGRGGEPSTAFVVRHDTVLAVTLVAVDSLEDQVNRFRLVLEGNGRYRDLAGQLGAALLGPLLPLLGADLRHLYVAPDGALHRVPFDLLILPDGRHVFERFATSLVASGATLSALRGRPRPNGPLQSLVVANVTHSTAPGAPPLPPLPASDLEGTIVEGMAGAVTRLEARDATRPRFLQAVTPQLSLVHIATHAQVSEWAPTRVALRFASSPGDDGRVGLADLASLPLRADLVVLSACQSAVGPLRRGEGMQALTTPLLAAGARSVLATQWLISDAGTVPVVQSLYAALADGHTVASALQQARLAMWRAGRPPRDWAAFVALGDADVIIPLRQPRRARWWWSLVLPAALLPVAARWRRPREHR